MSEITPLVEAVIGPRGIEHSVFFEPGSIVAVVPFVHPSIETGTHRVVLRCGIEVPVCLGELARASDVRDLLKQVNGVNRDAHTENPELLP